MKRKIFTQQQLSLACLLSIIVLLPGCEWPGSKKVDASAPSSNDAVAARKPAADDGSEVLVSMEGTPLITKKMFDEELQVLLEKDPRMQMAHMMRPEFVEQQYLNALSANYIAERYVKEKGIDQTPDYKKALEDILKMGRQVVDGQYFRKEFPVEVTTSEVKEFYEENKDEISGILLSQGGINTVGVEFGSQDEATAFFDKVKGNATKFDSLVKEGDLDEKRRDFRLVNNISVGVDKEIRDALEKMTTFPSIEMVQADDSYWVINAIEKEDKKYRPFAEIKDELEQSVKQRKQAEVIKDAIEGLKEEYNVAINTDYFAQKQEERAEIMRKAIEEHQAALQAQQEAEQSEQIQADACDVIDTQDESPMGMTHAA